MTVQTSVLQDVGDKITFVQVETTMKIAGCCKIKLMVSYITCCNPSSKQAQAASNSCMTLHCSLYMLPCSTVPCFRTVAWSQFAFPIASRGRKKLNHPVLVQNNDTLVSYDTLVSQSKSDPVPDITGKTVQRLLQWVQSGKLPPFTVHQVHAAEFCVCVMHHGCAKLLCLFL